MNRIRELREASGWTQAQLGKKIGAARNTVSGYETEDRQLTPVLICALCDIFGCTADYLLGRSDSRFPTMTGKQARLLDAYDAADERDQAYIDHLLRLDVPESKKDASAS
jgi:transcriptional regulator with XRE-family HTH domain